MFENDVSTSDQPTPADSYTRREAMRTAAGLALGLSVGGALAGSAAAPAYASGSMLAVTWGPPWLTVAKTIASSWSRRSHVSVTWQAHQGSAADILPKISATWPHTPYALVEVWNPVFDSMLAAGWLETVGPHDPALPNLKHVPEEFIIKDKAGRWVTVPESLTGTMWGYRTDLVHGRIKTLDDLLSPSFKGKIAFPAPTLNSGLQLVSAALANGGSEHHIEPGFAFVKELAKRGNIASLPASDVDVTNALTTGQASVAFANIADWATVAKSFPVTVLNRRSGPGLVDFLFNEGWAVIKGPQASEAKSLANFFIQAGNDAKFNRATGEGPVASGARFPTSLTPYLYKTAAERKEYGYIPDYTYLASVAQSWNTRWEAEIVSAV